MKKVKFMSHYYPTFEKGVPGYSIFLVLVARQKPSLNCYNSLETKLNSDFVELMSQKEKEMEDFLNKYYDEEPIEKTYTNINKVCKIKEIDLGFA